MNAENSLSLTRTDDDALYRRLGEMERKQPEYIEPPVPALSHGIRPCRLDEELGACVE